MSISLPVMRLVSPSSSLETPSTPCSRLAVERPSRLSYTARTNHIRTSILDSSPNLETIWESHQLCLPHSPMPSDSSIRYQISSCPPASPSYMADPIRQSSLPEGSRFPLSHLGINRGALTSSANLPTLQQLISAKETSFNSNRYEMENSSDGSFINKDDEDTIQRSFSNDGKPNIPAITTAIGIDDKENAVPDITVTSSTPRHSVMVRGIYEHVSERVIECVSKGDSECADTDVIIRALASMNFSNVPPQHLLSPTVSSIRHTLSYNSLQDEYYTPHDGGSTPVGSEVHIASPVETMSFIAADKTTPNVSPLLPIRQQQSSVLLHGFNLGSVTNNAIARRREIAAKESMAFMRLTRETPMKTDAGCWSSSASPESKSSLRSLRTDAASVKSSKSMCNATQGLFRSMIGSVSSRKRSIRRKSAFVAHSNGSKFYEDLKRISFREPVDADKTGEVQQGGNSSEEASGCKKTDKKQKKKNGLRGWVRGGIRKMTRPFGVKKRKSVQKLDRA